MKKTPLTSSTVTLAALLLGACASTPPTPPALVEARGVVQSAEMDPQVLSSAALELKKATDALRRAETMNAKGDSLAAIESAAYVARREAETALATARAKRDEATIQKAETERERARADASTMTAQRAQADAAMARTEAFATRAEAAAAQQQADAAKAQAEAAKVQANDAESRAQAARGAAVQAQVAVAVLQQELIQLQAQQTDRGMLVTLGDVLFETGRAEIKPAARDALRKLAAFLRDHPERRVLIEGHTDSVGDESFNLVLSQRRAEAVAAALGALGIAHGRVATRGYGEGYPVADNMSATNRALNRRVEVYISDSDQPVRARG